jgi:hypothetical protein
MRLRLLNRVITNLGDDALRHLGLKVSQMKIRAVAARLGVLADGGRREKGDGHAGRFVLRA